MGNKNARLNELIDILQARGMVSVKELAAELNVSEMTIRRDLKTLEGTDIAENIGGSVIYNPAHSVLRINKEYNLALETEYQNEEKSAIGKYATTLIQPDETIIIDTGTTTVHIAHNLPVHKNLSVLCYNINILMELRRLPNVKLLFAGGHYHSNAQMFESPQGIDFIRSIRVHKAFISAAGVHEGLGVTCVNSYEVETKKAVLRSALQKILVVDASKFGAVHSSYFCDLDAFDAIITNRSLSPEWVDIIRRHKIELHLV